MDSYSFYKSIYDREVARRIYLDKAINIPMTILTLIIGLNSIYFDQDLLKTIFTKFGIDHFVTGLIGISILISVFYLTKCYNNLFKGFAYRNLALTSEIRNFERTEIPNYNEKVEKDEKMDFESILIEKIIDLTDDHTILNDQRSLYLYRSKTFLIISLILTVIELIITTLK